MFKFVAAALFLVAAALVSSVIVAAVCAPAALYCVLDGIADITAE